MRDESRTFMWRRHVTIVTAVALLIALGGIPAIAQDDSGSAGGAGLQAASWLATVPYGAAKVAYAVGGGIVGSLAWVMSGGNTETAQAIWVPSMTGSYIIHPRNLTGDEAIHFVGGTPDEPVALATTTR